MAASSRATSNRRWRRAQRGADAAPPAGVAGPTADQIMALYRDTPFEEVPLDAMRRTIATRLVQAMQTIPHFYLTADVDIGRAPVAARGGQRGGAAKDGDGNPAFKLSVNDLIIKAWAVALQRVPAANAVWAEDRILRFRHSDIAVAVAIEGGLITPVIRAADSKSLTAISAEMKELAGARAREQAHAARIPGRLHPRSPISACTGCASSRPSSIRRTPPFSRSAPRAGRRSSGRTAASPLRA